MRAIFACDTCIPRTLRVNTINWTQYKTAYKFTHGYIDAMACARELTILKDKLKQNGHHLTNGISKFTYYTKMASVQSRIEKEGVIFDPLFTDLGVIW